MLKSNNEFKRVFARKKNKKNLQTIFPLKYIFLTVCFPEFHLKNNKNYELLNTRGKSLDVR